jgi:hypothetical protein
VPVLEKDDEYKLVEFCALYRIKCVKLRLASQNAWPDRTLLYRGHVMFLELKRKGEKPNPLQQFTINSLARDGFMALWTDDIEAAKDEIYEWKLNVDDSR